MSDRGAFAERGRPREPGPRHPGGRPRSNVSPEQVQQLRAAGLSLRQIARQLRLGYGTVHRVTQMQESQPGAIQNSPAGVL